MPSHDHDAPTAMTTRAADAAIDDALSAAKEKDQKRMGTLCAIGFVAVAGMFVAATLHEKPPRPHVERPAAERQHQVGTAGAQAQRIRMERDDLE